MEGGSVKICTEMMHCELKSLGCIYSYLNTHFFCHASFPQTNLFSFSTQRQLHLTVYMMLDNLKCIFCVIKVFQYSGQLSQLLIASRIILSMKKKTPLFSTQIIVTSDNCDLSNWETLIPSGRWHLIRLVHILKIGYCQLYAYWI